jgi:hypothetical protein
MKANSSAYRVSVKRPAETILLRTTKFGWEIYIRIDLTEIRWRDVDWTYLALVKTVMDLLSSIECWEYLEWLSNWQLLKDYSHPFSQSTS